MVDIFDSIPERLRPLRSSRSDFRYNDLSGKTLSLEEKIWLFKEYDGENEVREDQIIGNKNQLMKRYGLYKYFFAKNYKSYKNGSMVMPGGQFGISDKYVKEITDKIMIARHASQPLTSTSLKPLLNEAFFKTQIDRGKVNPAFEEIDTRTYKKFKETHDLVEWSQNAIQQAQIDACKDPYMSYHWYMICYALSAFLYACQKWNIDATTYVFQPKGKGAKAIKLLNEGDYSIDIEDKIVLKNEIKSTLQGSKLPFAIKNMMMISAAGEAGEFVLVVAIKEMGVDDWFAVEVIGMSISVTVGTKGTLYFCHTRCGTVLMWKDYFTRVVIPTIILSNAYHLAKDDEGNPQRNFLSSDGEDIILRNAYDPAIRLQFVEARIDYGRVGAGTTRIHNACDRQFTFRDCHKEVKRVQANSVDVSNSILERNVRTAFQMLREKYPTISIGSGHINNIVEGILVIVYVYQKIHNPIQAMRAFKVSGQHCEADPITGSTVSFEKMMAQCYSDIPLEQLELMKTKAPILVEEFVKTQGRVPHEELIKVGIKAGLTSLNRDNLCPIRHSSEIISHEETHARFLEYNRVHSPEFLAAEKAQADAVKVAAKEAQELEKRETDARKLLADAAAVEGKKESVLAEKRRFDALPPNERAIEVATKKAKKEADKAAKIIVATTKANNKAQKLADAAALVGAVVL